MRRFSAAVLMAILSSSAPSRRAAADETGGDSAKPAAESAAPIPTTSEDVVYALGARIGGLFVPSGVLSPFLQQYGALNSGSGAVQFTRRKGTLDIVLSLDFSWYNPPDGNWLGANKDPALDTHYVQFHHLSLLSLDVAFVWHHDLLPWLAIMVGGGVGLGVVLGDIWLINGSTCNAANAGDPTQCYPGNVGPIRPDDPNLQMNLDKTTQAQQQCLANGGTAETCKDTRDHPYFHAASEKPPVLPVLSFILGFRFKLHRHFNINLTGGFRNGFVFDVGPEYVF